MPKKDLIDLRKRQIDTTPAWNTAFSVVTAAPGYADPEIQADMRDALLSMKDSRIAYWRYSVLLDDEFAVAMHVAAAKAIASFNLVKGVTTDPAVKTGIDGLLVVMNELNAITDGSKKLVDLQNQQEREHTGPTRDKLDQYFQWRRLPR
jgi:hypothetical protein